MSEIVLKAAQLMEVLPEKDKLSAYEFIRELVLAWDPDFVKTTPWEAQVINAAEQSGFVDTEEIDWENIGEK